MLNYLRTHWSRVVPMGFALAGALTLGGIQLYDYLNDDDCCQPGASCCYPGSPCCANKHHESQ
jgi:hypothetical protein